LLGIKKFMLTVIFTDLFLKISEMSSYSNRNNADSLFDLKPENIIPVLLGFVREDNATDIGLNGLDEDFHQNFDKESPFTTMKASVDHCKTFARKHCSKVVRRILSNKSKTVYIICTRGKKTNNKRHVAAPGTDERDKQPKGIWMRV
ncbi:hypothetical protein CU098_009051, partial [Rhizopus stolonifer]